jgi:hypothetical protein
MEAIAEPLIHSARRCSRKQESIELNNLILILILPRERSERMPGLSSSGNPRG